MTPIDICLLQWKTYNARMQKAFDTLDDSRYLQPIVEGGNSPSWLLGHLVDTDDELVEILGIRPRLFPDLKKIYHHERGVNQTGHLAKAELVQRWKAISEELDRAFKGWSEKDWMSRHTLVSEEDFNKEPHRNKLNVMMTRVAHKASHLGQVAMLK
jgi:uncharacterized damage-inducible protein DinB